MIRKQHRESLHSWGDAPVRAEGEQHVLCAFCEDILQSPGPARVLEFKIGVFQRTRGALPEYVVQRHCQFRFAKFISFSGKVFSEYTILTKISRDVSDAHLSGDIHISSLGDAMTE